jgi:hypothetical protein
MRNGRPVQYAPILISDGNASKAACGANVDLCDIAEVAQSVPNAIPDFERKNRGVHGRRTRRGSIGNPRSDARNEAGRRRRDGVSRRVVRFPVVTLHDGAKGRCR